MKRLARSVLGVAAPTILLALVIGGTAGTWLFAAVSPLVPGALIVIGAGGQVRTRRLVAIALALTLSLEAGMLGILGLDRLGDGAAVWLGLPAGTLLMLVALGLVPLVLIPWAHAALFDDASARANDPTDRRQP